MMMIVATSIYVIIKRMSMKETLLQAALKKRKPKVLLSKIDLVKGSLGKRKKNRTKK